MASQVFFIKASKGESDESISEKSARLFREGNFGRCFREKDFTAVKVHVGEGDNNTYLKAGCIKGLVRELLALKTKPFITDSSTLYAGRRHNAIDHSILASEHGFDMQGLGVPFFPPDGLFGTSEMPVRIDGLLNKEVSIATDIVRCQSILSVAHLTGHCATCLGGTLKTIGMGCASRKGKMRQHAALKPQVSNECTLCGECLKHCPVDAISIDDVKAHIDQDKCIGCAECVAVCRFDAVKYDWQAESKLLQQNIAEHALGALKNKNGRAVFFNYLINVTKDCDCFTTPDMSKIVDDIGICASSDPLAVDQAALDLVEQAGGKSLKELIKDKKLDPHYQLEHAEKIGLGSRKYDIIGIE